MTHETTLDEATTVVPDAERRPQRRLAALIGGLLALVALFAVLTSVPITSGPTTAVDKTITSEARESESVSCANVSFVATVTYTVKRPLLDLWGFRTIDDATIDPAALTAAATGKCGGPISDLGAAAAVQTEPCPVDIAGLVASALATDNWGSACDSRLTYYSGVNDGVGETMTRTYSGPSTLAPSGFGRGDWCPDFWTEARFTTGSGSFVYTAATTAGDFCLPLP